MQFSVTTKVESAWYVDPDLLGGDADEEPRSEDDGEGEPRPTETMTLGASDLEEVGGVLGHQTEIFCTGARHYRRVSLKGALLAPDESGSLRGSAAPLKGRRAQWRRLFERTARGFVAVVAYIDSGRLPPVQLATLAFLAGVATTLVGVLVAL